MTKFGGALAAASMMLFCGIFLLIFIPIPGIRLAIVIFVIILMAAFLVHDTQIIVGGSHRKFQLELDDYCVGALIIYSDILTIFVYLLELLNGN